jgi:hypothetical protein
MRKNLLLLLLIMGVTTQSYSQLRMPKVTILESALNSEYGFIRSKSTWTIFRSDLNKPLSTLLYSEFMIDNYLDETDWPSAINTDKKRQKPKANREMANFTMYQVCAFKSGSDYALIYVPEDENRSMPQGYVPSKDLFFLVNQSDIQCDSSQIREFHLSPLNAQSLSYSFEKVKWFFYDFSQNLKPDGPVIETNSNQERIYKSDMTDAGFFFKTLIAKDGSIRYLGDYYAGNNLDAAKSVLKGMNILESINPFCENGTKFKMIQDLPDAKECVNLSYEPKFGLQVSLRIIDNSQEKENNLFQTGYCIRLEVQKYSDSKEDLWQQLYKNFQAEGFQTIKKEFPSGIIREKFDLLEAKEVKWILFTQEPNRLSYLNPIPPDILPFKTEPYQGIWRAQGGVCLISGRYEFHSSLPEDSLQTGRSLLIYGFRDTEESKALEAKEIEKEAPAQKLRYSSTEEFNRKFSEMEAKVLKNFKECQFSNIQRYEFEGPGSQRIPVSNGTQIALIALTFNQNARLWLNQTDHEIVESSTLHLVDGMFVQSLQIRSNGSGNFLGEILYDTFGGGDKSLRTILFVGFNEEDANTIVKNKADEEKDKEIEKQYEKEQDEFRWNNF